MRGWHAYRRGHFGNAKGQWMAARGNLDIPAEEEEEEEALAAKAQRTGIRWGQRCLLLLFLDYSSPGSSSHPPCADRCYVGCSCSCIDGLLVARNAHLASAGLASAAVAGTAALNAWDTRMAAAQCYLYVRGTSFARLTSLGPGTKGVAPAMPLDLLGQRITDGPRCPQMQIHRATTTAPLSPPSASNRAPAPVVGLGCALGRGEGVRGAIRGGVGHRLADPCARLGTWLHVPAKEGDRQGDRPAAPAVSLS
jgi:hypothetical protein